MTLYDKKSHRVLRTIILFVSIGDLHVKVWFGTVESVAVNVLLETQFKDRYIRGIFPGKRPIVPWSSEPVPILTRQFIAKE